MPKKPLSETKRASVVSALEACGGSDRGAWALLKTQGVKVALGTVAKVKAQEAKGLDLEGRLAATQALVRSQKRELARRDHRVGELLIFNDEILAAISALPTMKPHRYARPKKSVRESSPVDVTALWGDWHVGEIISASQLEGFNEYNWAIAQARVQLLVQETIKWVATHRSGYNIQDLHVLCLGDFLSGDIHDELRITNEFPTPVAIVKCASLMAWALAALAPHFRTVHVHGIAADNHSRLVKKPQAKQKCQNSFNYPLYELVRAYLVDYQVDIRVTTYDSARAQVDVNGQSLLIDHGDTVKAWMGLPYYGMQREDGIEARKRNMRGSKTGPFDTRIRGHWHQVALGPFGIVNGALCGTTEYDYLCGRFAPPSQVTFLMHPKHGWFDLTCWDLSSAKKANKCE